MDTQKYEILLRAIQNGSLSKTALDMGYTQSGVTHIIRSIEDHLDVKILDRSYAGVTLTPDGERLYPLIRAICLADSQLQEAVNEIRGLHVGVIRVGAFSSISTLILPYLFQRMEQKYPGIEFEIRQGHYTEIQKWLLDGTVDVGFMGGPISHKLRSMPLLTDRLLVLLPRGHALEHKEKIHPEDLSPYPFILLDEGDENEIEIFLRRSDISPRIRCRVKDDYTVMALVEAGLGIGMLHELILMDNRFDLVLRDMDPPLYRDIKVVYPPNGNNPNLVQKFIEELKAL